jgi:hypothetical protein
MRFSPKRTQSVAVIVTCAVAIILLGVFIHYRFRRYDQASIALATFKPA